MAATFVVEDGSNVSGANSYATLDYADTYHENRLFVTTWTSASDDDKETALVWATRLLDESVKWNGYKYDEDQALEWPRGGAYDRSGYSLDTDEIPAFLKDAVSEFARQLIASDRTAEAGTKGFSRLRLEPMEAWITKTDREDIIPRAVWNMISFACVRRLGQTRYLERA